jgi:uncharacterized membrane protein
VGFKRNRRRHSSGPKDHRTKGSGKSYHPPRHRRNRGRKFKFPSIDIEIKIWLKLVIGGLIIAFIGGIVMVAFGTMESFSAGMIIGVIGVIITAVGILTGIMRLFNSALND